MPKLEVPDTSPVPVSQPLSVRYDNRALDAGASIGQTAISAGDKISQIGNEYFQKAAGAMADAAFNNAYANASTEFTQKVMQRISTPTDPDGTPNFQRLPQDIAALSQQVQGKYAGVMADPDVGAKFARSMTDLTTTQQIKSLSIARMQQQQYSTAALNTDLESNKNQALQNPQGADFYFNHAQQSIQSALKNGSISATTAQEQIERARSDIYFQGLDMQNGVNPDAVKTLLESKTPDQLHVTPGEYNTLKNNNESALKAINTQQVQQAKEQATLVKQQQDFNYQDLQVDLAGGKASNATIDGLYNAGKISHAQADSAKVSLINQQKKASTKEKTRSDILDSNQKGEVLEGKYSNSQINDSYQNAINYATKDGQQPSLLNKADIAASYKAPVTAFTKELEGTLVAGDTHQIVEAAQAYDRLSLKNPLAASKLDKNSLAEISYINSNLQHTNLSPDTVVQNAKKVIGADATVKAERLKTFNKQSDFKNENIVNTVKEMFPGNSLYEPKINPEDVATMHDLLKDAYQQTGDSNSAKTMVQNETKGVFGISEVNKTSMTFGHRNQLMFAPPELVYHHSADEIRHDLNSEITPEIQQKYNIKPDDVMLGSDSVTQQLLEKGGKTPVSYNMSYTGSDGQRHPIMNPATNTPMRYYPSDSKISQSNIDKGFDTQSEIVNTQKKIEDGSVTGLDLLNPGRNSTSKPSSSTAQQPIGPTSLQDSQVHQLKQAIAHNEGADYSTKGPLMPGHGDDRALGKYQILGSNIPVWSKEALGHSISQQEFLSRPDLQDKIAESKISEIYGRSHTMQDVLSEWHSGRGYNKALQDGAKDSVSGLRTADYVKNGIKYIHSSARGN